MGLEFRRVLFRSASAIIVLRILSTKYHWGLPVLKGDVKPVKETTEKKDENKDDENEK